MQQILCAFPGLWGGFTQQNPLGYLGIRLPVSEPWQYLILHCPYYYKQLNFYQMQRWMLQDHCWQYQSLRHTRN